MVGITASVLCATVMASIPTFSRNGAFEACKNAQNIIEASEKNNLDPYILTAMIQVESNWSPKVVSVSNACGLTQVLARYSKHTCSELKDPKTSIFEGARMLSYWTNVYAKGDVELGLCAYNEGFRCGRNKRRKRGLTYAKKVARMAASLKTKGEDKCLSTYCY